MSYAQTVNRAVCPYSWTSRKGAFIIYLEGGLWWFWGGGHSFSLLWFRGGCGTFPTKITSSIGGRGTQNAKTLGTGHYLCRRGGGREKYVGKIKISVRSAPVDHVNSKWPPFFIQYLRDDRPPAHLISTSTSTLFKFGNILGLACR